MSTISLFNVPSLFPRHRWNPFREIDFFNPTRRNLLDCDCSTAYSVSQPQIQEHDDTYNIRIEVPGRTREQIELAVENNTLTVSSKNVSEDKNNKEQVQVQTLSEFRYEFSLPEHIVQENISANLSKGILTLTIPKDEAKLLEKKKYIEIGESA